ncbi:porin [Psychromonas ossibalaenae]|uniref:porin n=1 Tax=Psychromonas ossibalaenae TaxID=444922 RepID=UPI00037A75F4|nr:porin [Psychromonas ossibalaenae]
MKKTLLATAIMSGLLSAGAGAATVYEKDGDILQLGGRAEVRGLFSDSVEGSMEDKSRARINVAGRTQISENLAGFGFVEYQIDRDNADQETKVNNRYLFAGFDTAVGAFSFGRQDTANVQIAQMSDVASNYSGANKVIDAAHEQQSNNFLYAGNFLDNALSVKANYIAASEADADSFGASARYAPGFGLEIGLGYADSENNTNVVNSGLSYTFESFYAGITYGNGELLDDNDQLQDFTIIEAAAQYIFTNEFRLIGTYVNQEINDEDEQDYLAIEAQYRFTPVIRAFAIYQANQLDGAEDELFTGIRYDF